MVASPTITAGCGKLYYNAHVRTLSADGKSWINVLDSDGNVIPDSTDRWVEVYHDGQLIWMGNQSGVGKIIDGLPKEDVKVNYTGYVLDFDLGEPCDLSTTTSFTSPTNPPETTASSSTTSSTNTTEPVTSSSLVPTTSVNSTSTLVPLPLYPSSTLPVSGNNADLTVGLVIVAVTFFIVGASLAHSCKNYIRRVYSR